MKRMIHCGLHFCTLCRMLEICIEKSEGNEFCANTSSWSAIASISCPRPRVVSGMWLVRGGISPRHVISIDNDDAHVTICILRSWELIASHCRLHVCCRFIDFMTITLSTLFAAPIYKHVANNESHTMKREYMLKWLVPTSGRQGLFVRWQDLQIFRFW